MCVLVWFLTAVFAAFQVKSQRLQGRDDPRRIVEEVLYGPTFVHSCRFSLTVNMSFYESQMSRTGMFESIMMNFLDGLTTLLPGHNGPVYSLPIGTETTQVKTGSGPYDGNVIVAGSAYLYSFNATAPANLDVNTWINHAIGFFRPKAALSDIGELLLNATFMVRCDPSMLFLRVTVMIVMKKHRDALFGPHSRSAP